MKIEFPVDFERNVTVDHLDMGTVFLLRNSVYRIIDCGGLVDGKDVPLREIVVFNLTNNHLTTIVIDEIVILLDCTLKVNGRSKGGE